MIFYALNMKVDQRDPTPLPVQLANVLREQIQAGEFAESGMLPSEAQLQQEHGVSRGTVRQAIMILKREGLVRTIPARGTFIL